MAKLLRAIENSPHVAVGQMMLMALFTGMRRGEIFRLRWDDIDFERGFINIKDSKGGKDTTVPLNNAARQLLNNVDKTESPYVFPGRGGRKRVDAKRQLNEIREEAGLPKDFRPMHGLRHAYASTLASSGVDLYTISKLLTHKSTAMTARYAHLNDAAMRRASEIAGQIVTGSARPDNVVSLKGDEQRS